MSTIADFGPVPGTVVPRPWRGFTLMETLVMLVLLSFAVLLMFQMLGSYRIAQQRVGAQSERIGREALLNAWLAETIAGEFALKASPLKGDALRFAGLTLNPLYASPGAPTPFSWRLDFTASEGWTVTYSEYDEVRWSTAFPALVEPRFVYFDGQGELHDRWPPALGVQAEIPKAVALLDSGEQGVAVAVNYAAVHGPGKEQLAFFQPEQD